MIASLAPPKTPQTFINTTWIPPKAPRDTPKTLQNNKRRQRASTVVVLSFSKTNGKNVRFFSEKGGGGSSQSHYIVSPKWDNNSHIFFSVLNDSFPYLTLAYLYPCQKSQAAEETLIARRRRIAKMAPVSTFANLPTPVGPTPCARAPSTGRSVLALQIILETQRLSACLTKINVKIIPVEKMQSAR